MEVNKGYKLETQIFFFFFFLIGKKFIDVLKGEHPST